MKLTAREYSIVITALKELKKIELKEAKTFTGFGGDEWKRMAAECRANAAETEAIIKKLIDNVRKNAVKEKS